MSSPAELPYNLNNELAKERNRAAAERTLMAWIRTSLSLISFGFGIDQIVAALQANFNNNIDTLHLSRILGLAFILIGTLALGAAALSHAKNLKRIEKGAFIYQSEFSISLAVAIALIAVGIIAFLGILISRG
ncbi:MAG: hypothetical protein RLZZ490_1293 [Cyanobacteriota bacterium]|jgi:putative membrane protein